MSNQVFSSHFPTPWRPLAVMLLASLAVHMLLLVMRPLSWQPSLPPPPARLSVTLASPMPKSAPPAEQAVPPAAAVPPPVVSHRLPAQPSRKVPVHHVAPPKPAPSRLETPPATPDLPRPARHARPAQAEPDSPAPTGSGHFSAQSLLAQGRSAARALDGADDDGATDSSSNGARQLLVYGRSATGVEWKSYVEAWRLKMERLGTLNYPEVARDQEASLELAVVIDSSGALRSVKLRRGSGQPAINQAAIDLVKMAAPFAPFPAQLAARANALEIVRRWNFTRDNRFAGG
ncbi:TonB family protein [Crenobacter sp. SG2305]|uniref:TonB family protein n=1 Tax=Crenobacter oryzisoli TaxID=3056844 RepID=UPI0025AB3F4B|nr:TonB family protein [Crenobacter sp. SG2305]MDN0083057.1 TonB family protein [Crenobacter sp. SG2305]